MKYKAVLFDLDGVIINSEPLHVLAFKLVLLTHGIALSDDEYKQFFAGRTDAEGFKAYFEKFPININLTEIRNEKTKAYLQIAQSKLIPYEGIVPLIRQLSKELPLALVTGSLRAEAEIALQTCGVSDCFKTIIAADDVKRGKPSPEGYLKASSLLGISPENCVIVEDSPSGVKAANNASIDCIAITTTHSRDELSNATKVVDALNLALF